MSDETLSRAALAELLASERDHWQELAERRLRDLVALRQAVRAYVAAQTEASYQRVHGDEDDARDAERRCDAAERALRAVLEGSER